MRPAIWIALFAACGDTAAPAPLPEVTDPTAWVDPRIGTGGLGYNYGSCFVGAAVPHGLAKPAPDTDGHFGTIAFQHYSGYYADDDRIQGFSQLHLHGTGATDYGVLSLMPTLAFDPAKTTVVAYETHFDKTTEDAEPGYYGVTLDGDIRVELTATARVAVHRYTLPAAGSVVIDLAKTLDSGMVDAASIAVDDAAREVTGQLHHLGGMSKGFGGYTVYFVARATSPFTHTTWATGAQLALPAGATTIAIGMSFVSPEGARKNLDTEAASLDFDAIAGAAHDAWAQRLGNVLLTGGNAAQRRTFYTSYYHAFLMPTVIDDVDGTYVLAGHAPAVATGYHQMSDFSLWDTYRTVEPLYGWLAPDSARDSAYSLLAFGTTFGAFPKWPVAIGESGTMLGASAEIAIADIDARVYAGDASLAQAAYPILRAAAMDSTPPAGGRGGRDQVDVYMQYGYVPTTAGRSASVTTEYSDDDFALAELAGKVGATADHDALLARRHGWADLYDPSVGFLRARNADGSFPATAFDPTAFTPDFAEADAWQSMWMTANHDPDTLATTLGGADAAIAQLEMMFELTKQNWDQSDESAANFPRPYYWASNEPDINAAFVFAQLGRPDLTQKWVRWIVDTIYTDQPTGVPGNDDGGTMGGWYVLSTLGVYPIAGSDRWIVGAPRFPSARIGTLQIVADGSGPYVKSVDLDGVPLDTPEITQAQLASASVLHFVMSDSATSWGR
jgi:predicted alpha-1,2-mannosidase